MKIILLRICVKPITSKWEEGWSFCTFNPFLATVPALNHLKTPKTQMIYGFFKVYKMRKWARNELKDLCTYNGKWDFRQSRENNLLKQNKKKSIFKLHFHHKLMAIGVIHLCRSQNITNFVILLRPPIRKNEQRDLQFKNTRIPKRVRNFKTIPNHFRLDVISLRSHRW